MNLSEFCVLHGIDLAALVDDVDATIGLQPGDALLAAGSLVEGLGNARSDLDLLMIASPREAELAPRAEVALRAGRGLVDVRLVRRADVADLARRLEEWHRRPWDIVHAADFSLEERVLLYRIAQAPVLWPQADAQVVRPSRDALLRLKLHVARQLGRTVQVDLSGHAGAQEYDSLTFAAQDLLGHAVDALLAGHGLGNPLAKWRSRYLGQLPAGWEASLTPLPTGLNAAERVWALHRAPSRPAPGACLEHALQISAFARSVFLWAERSRHGVASGFERLDGAANGALGSASRLPYLDFDVDCRVAADRTVLGRLNSFGEPLELSDDELVVAVLCDGRTTLEGAESSIGAEAVRGALTRFAASGFIRRGQTRFRREPVDRVRLNG